MKVGLVGENMNYTAEKHFVQKFIIKSRRERLFYELTTPEKRYDGVSRFCHQAKELLAPSLIIMEGDDMDRSPKFACFVRQHNEICCVLSPDYSMDGRLMSLEDAVSKAIICPDAVLILGSTFAVVFGEPMKGGRGKYLLSEK